MIAALWTVPALAYEWDREEAPRSHGMTLHLCEGDFTREQSEAIFAGADAWEAGDGKGLRGALWTYKRGPDRPDGSCAFGNGFNEIYAESEQWFRDHDMGGAIAVTLNEDVEVSTEADFVWNTVDAGRWSALLPSQTVHDQLSLGMVALHEFGHGLGFNHDDAVVAVMNSSYPNGGDLGQSYAPHADDYAGLIRFRPHPSEGTNLLLGKFTVEPGDPGDSIELWERATAGWTVCQREVAATSGPEPIYAQLHDTSGQEIRPLVEWTLSADRECFDEHDYNVAYAEVVMIAGGPTLVHPKVYDFSAVPKGRYLLCARIDADEAIREVSEADNQVQSEAIVEVQSCP